MIVIEDIETVGAECPFVVAAVGTFDGVHLGHQEILGRVLRKARERRGTACAYTFVNHPLEILDPKRCPRLITPSEVKLQILKALGLDLCVAQKFTTALAATPPEIFVKEVLVEGLHVKEVCVGSGFAFGKDRKGDTTLLQGLGRTVGFGVEVVPPVAIRGQVVSSTLIRGLLQKGEVREAAKFLGRPYLVNGCIERGSGRGRGVVGYPTANFPPPPDLLIPDSVYAGKAYLQGRLVDTLINVGCAPTFGGEARRVEAHLLDHPGEELYGEWLTLFFIEWIREERTFRGPEELREQIKRDHRKAQEVLAGIEASALEKWALQA
ncbi:MAG: riboflavin biosynthesis protein RibF [candidate division NC10 bacterium]|nr:riboflavin biosynthesis protein RibF [candidate division NC10 bacterium]